MTDVYFYHLLHQPLDKALTALLEKCLERNWRSVVQCATASCAKALDDSLWSASPESFLPHGTSQESGADGQPVLLTTGDENPNGAVVRIFVEGCQVLPALERPAATPYQRVMLVFDGRDPADVEQARDQWRRLKGRKCALTYWQQDENGRWSKKE